MPQPRRSTSRSSSSAKARSGGTGAKSGGSQAKRSGAKSSAAKSSAGGTRARSTASKARGSKATGRAGSARAKASTSGPEARVEAAAERLRKLNERIIEAAKDAGETTLSSYEKALKTIASTIERGPGRSDVEWISQLATAQAKFIRDVTAMWTSAARDLLK